jgi:glyoxylase-like metal-dependent hydrolase (beta-lactamase superfamily II)
MICNPGLNQKQFNPGYTCIKRNIMQIEPFFDPNTSTVTYVVSDPETQRCAIIDSVLDFDLHSGRLSSQSADTVIDYIKKQNLQVDWILETHVHADHLTAASYLKDQLGGKIGIGENIKKVLSHWIPIFNTGSDTPSDGSQFDVLFADGAQFKIGNLNVNVIHTPGHTPDGVCYYIEDAVFVGDTIFMPYVGTGRADFPGSNAENLYRSIQKIFALPDQTRIYTCHDYPPNGQGPAWESTVAGQKKNNSLINDSVKENEFISARNKRDLNLPVPRLLLPSIQVNLRAGKLGAFDSSKTQYIKIPINKITSS